MLNFKDSGLGFECAKHSSALKGVCVCVCLCACVWGWGGTSVYQALCLQKPPRLHLGTTGDMTAIRSLCSWLIACNMSVEWLLQAPHPALYLIFDDRIDDKERRRGLM